MSFTHSFIHERLLDLLNPIGKAISWNEDVAEEAQSGCMAIRRSMMMMRMMMMRMDIKEGRKEGRKSHLTCQ